MSRFIALSSCVSLKKLTYLTSLSTSKRYAQIHHDADSFDLKTLKIFVRAITYEIDDNYDDLKTRETFVLQYRKEFTIE